MTKAHAGMPLGNGHMTIPIDYQDILWTFRYNSFCGRKEVPNPRVDTISFLPDDEVGRVASIDNDGFNAIGHIYTSEANLSRFYRLFFTPQDGGIQINPPEMASPIPGQSVIKHVSARPDSHISAEDGNGISYTRSSTAKMAISAGAMYTISVWARGASGGEALEIFAFEYTDDSNAFNAANTTSKVVTLTTEWKRYTYTRTAGTGTVRCWTRFDNETAGQTIYYCGAQLENFPWATGLMASGGSRVGASLQYEIAGNLVPNPNEFTINAWVNLYGARGGMYQPIFEYVLTSAGGVNRLLFMFDFIGGRYDLSCWIGNKDLNGFVSVQNLIQGINPVNEWHMYTLTYYNQKYSIFIDGVLRAEAATNVKPYFTPGTSFNIGGRLFERLNGMMSNFLLSPRYTSSEELEMWFRAGRHAMVDPYDYSRSTPPY